MTAWKVRVVLSFLALALAAPLTRGQIQNASQPDQPIKLSAELVVFDAQVIDKKPDALSKA